MCSSDLGVWAVLSPSVGGQPLSPPTRRSLGEPLPHQLADRPRVPPNPVTLSSVHHAMVRRHPVLANVSTRYSRDRDRFLTCYAPVRHSVFPSLATGWTPFDLHVLSTPPAFVLSQDQTLRRILERHRKRWCPSIEMPRTRGKYLDYEALAPSDGASTTRILTVRLRFTRPRRKQASGAVARTRSLVLSSVFKERLALTTRALTRALVPALPAPPAPEGPCGAESQSNDQPEGRQPEGRVSETFLGRAL